MRIWNNGGLTPPVGADSPLREAGASRGVRTLFRCWPGYVVAIVWVVVGALLYATEVLKLLAKLG